ncbi:MAG TPA: hypothetical protein DHW63_08580, partial [Hyphomonadaceae bacterium]|nr:hypothetical protein [Hyphomonadaceae bacterium]
MPIQALASAIEDGAARREVLAQYEEFRRTGKVRTTLGEDDKVVRELHAAEVLKTPLSSLDAKWPREIGAKAGGRVSAPARPPARPTAKIIELDVVPAPRPQRVMKAPPPLPRELPVGAPLAKKEKTLPRCTLTDSAPVVQAPSIGPKTAKRLEALGVKTVADLLALAPEEAEAKADARHISAQTIRDWQAQALLACTAPGLKSREAQALVACGVRSANDLASADAVALCDAVAQWGLSPEGQR